MAVSRFDKSEIGNRVSGIVESFDKHIGLGEITLEDSRQLDFHCTNIADGTRTIELNTKVSAEIYFHPRGRFEAKNIRNI